MLPFFAFKHWPVREDAAYAFGRTLESTRGRVQPSFLPRVPLLSEQVDFFSECFILGLCYNRFPRLRTAISRERRSLFSAMLCAVVSAARSAPELNRKSPGKSSRR